MLNPPTEQLNAQERERGYSCAATDVWALMITLFNLLTGHSPWDRANEYCDDYMAFLGFPDQHVLERSFPVSRDFERVFTDYTEHTPAHRQGLDHLCDHLGTMTMFPTWVRPGVGPVAKRLDDLSMAHYDHELAQYNAYLQDLESDACKPAIFIPVACASSLSSDIALALCALPDSIFPSGHSGADDFIKVCSDTDKIAPDPEQVVSRHISWSSSAPESCSLPSLTPVLLDPFRDPTSTSSGPDTPEHAAADVAVHDGHVSYLGLDYSCTHEAVGKDNNLVHASLMIC
jgi:serine/threonine protein kinase